MKIKRLKSEKIKIDLQIQALKNLADELDDKKDEIQLSYYAAIEFLS